MLLLFAQTVEEMLFDYTIDSYKARALNLHTALLELRTVAQWIRQGRINAGTAIPLLEELDEKVRYDPVIGAEQRAVFTVYLERMKSDRTKPDSLVRTVEAMLIEIGQYYWAEILRKIPEAIRTPRNSRAVTALAGAFITEAELEGYHRSFLFHAARRYFWRQEIRDPDAINGFLGMFNGSKHTYRFLFRASPEFASMTGLLERFGITVLADPRDLRPMSAKVERFLRASETHPILVLLDNIEARDPLFARTMAERRIELVASVYAFHSHHDRPSWARACVAIQVGDPDRSLGLLNPPVSPMKRLRRGGLAENEDEVSRTLEILKGVHFGDGARRTYVKALDYHRAAMSVDIPESQLVSLWSALEGFLPPPDPESNRVQHYVGTLLPALTLTYVEKIFRYVSRTLEACGGPIRALIRGVAEPDWDFFSATVCLLTADEHENERGNLYAHLARNPLLRWRCFSLHDQFHTSSRCASAIAEHRTRVGWHIQRIYSARNQIVHSAESLPYLETLVENLHSYIDTLLHAVSVVGERARVVGRIEAALALLAVQEQSYLRGLVAGDVRVTRENFKSVLFGATNPLSPFHDRFSI